MIFYLFPGRVLGALGAGYWGHWALLLRKYWHCPLIIFFCLLCSQSYDTGTLGRQNAVTGGLDLNADKMSGWATTLGFKLLHSKKGGSKRFLNPEGLINAPIACRLPTTVPNLLLCIYCSIPQSARTENLPVRQTNEMAAWKGYLYFLVFCAPRVHQSE